MAFERPTLAELVTRIEADFVSRLTLTGAILRRAVLKVLSRVIAGAAHLQHGHLDYISKQLFPDTSDETYLIRQAALFGLTKTAATYATGTVEATGTNGTPIPIDTVLVRSDGVEYTVDAEVSIATGTATLALTASEAGEDGTLTVGDELTFESPISGVDSTAEVLTSTVDGTDEETTEALRTRLLERMQTRPSAGTAADYIAWAKEVAGVTRVWVSQELGIGTVVVRFVRDDDVGFIPSAGEVTEVQDYIDERRPITADVTVAAPTDTPIAFTIELTPDTSATRAAVEAELEDMLLRDAEPGGTTLLSAILVAVGNADGVTDFDVTVPAADVTRTAGQISSVGVITWV